MKSRSTIAADLICIFACVSGFWAQENMGLKPKVQTFYDQVGSLYQAKNLEGLMSLFADDFQIIMASLDREGAQNYLKSFLQSYDEIQATYTPLTVTQSGKFIKVVPG